jgi:hypothetical protein
MRGMGDRLLLAGDDEKKILRCCCCLVQKKTFFARACDECDFRVAVHETALHTTIRVLK